MRKLKSILAVVLIAAVFSSSSVVANAASISDSTRNPSNLLSDEQYVKQKDANVLEAGEKIDFAKLASDQRYVKAKEKELTKKLGKSADYFEKYRAWLAAAQKKGYFHDDGNGHIIADSAAKAIAPSGMGENYFSGISDLNELIDIGIYSFDESNGLQSHALECIQNPSLMKTMPEKSDITSANTAYYALGTVVHRNYQTLYARFLSGGSGGYAVALAFWLDMVRPNGQWDYKTRSGFVNKSFVCIYGVNSSKSVTHTSEWIGNYNYGYTGRFLFNLDILHAGSAAVGGGVEKDKHDWPAINEGYNDSGAIE